MRKLAWFLIISSLLAALAEWFHFHLPTISWAYNASHAADYLRTELVNGEVVYQLAWFGYAMSLLGLIVGGCMLVKYPVGWEMLPRTKRRLERFKSNRRGVISLGIIVAMVVLAGLDQLVVGKRALYVNYAGEIFFPAFMRTTVNGSDIGEEGDMAGAELDYRKLKQRAEEKGNGVVIMPIIPYAPTQDTAKVPARELHEENGLLIDEKGEPVNGSVSTLYDGDSEKRHLIYEYRDGVKQGLAVGRNLEGEQVYRAEFRKGELVEGSEVFSGKKMDKESFFAAGDGKYYKVFFHAAPPMSGEDHWLGTTGSGSDLVAYLYGGLQVNIKAALIYIPLIYLIGVSIGLLMGFFGGVFDLVFQRLIEIFSTIPFLFVVIIFSSMVPANNRGLMMILLILISFGWMGMTYLMRTAAMREKERDYVAAARVSGATTYRIIFSHILPNTVAILVTLVPFSVSGIIMSLTALDYLGFGLPTEYATWGTLLKEGLESFSKPWLVSSAFTALVVTLILVTFVGEAVRDAFDPKKFTTYK